MLAYLLGQEALRNILATLSLCQCPPFGVGIPRRSNSPAIALKDNPLPRSSETIG